MADQELHCAPSTLEVDYDKNLTALYKSITDQDWSRAITFCKKYPEQAATWVVRHYEDDEADDESATEQKEIMWRFLPLHSACARQPPAAVITALLGAYPDAAKCVDDQGMYALHYACGNQATRDVIRQLLVAFPDGAKIADPRGMLPIHYVACWGPSSIAVVNMLLVTNSQVAGAKDEDGNTPLALAQEGEYPEKDAVIGALNKWIESDQDVANIAVAAIQPTASAGSSGNTRQSASNMQNRSLFDGTESDVSSMESGLKPKSIYSRDGKLSNGLKNVYTVQEEEKKEDDFEDEGTRNGVSLAMATVASAATLGTVQSKLIKLQDDMEIKERGWKEKNNELQSTWTGRFNTLQAKAIRQECEVDATKEDLETAKTELTEKSTKLSAVEKELAETKEKLKTSTEERQGLQVTLGDLMEQHESFKKRSGNMNDRLGSLSVSLESMMEQQSMLTKSMKSRNAKNKESFQKRQTRLQEMLDMEKTMEEDEVKLEGALKKQSKEMEAIAAVIAAARG